MTLYKDIILKENGNVTVIALMILVILTIIGISASRTSTTDMQIARNQIPHKQDFFVSEGGQNREAAFIGTGGYPVTNINIPKQLDDPAVVDKREITTAGKSYDYEIYYEGHFLPPKGYSTEGYARYDYTVDTKGGTSKYGIDSRYYKIGPIAE
ncbi:MAG: pilus assembly PilX N-terminal domain-containing protein [Deltaproteobacteria bacterium]|nr:pilus assembly PilX N-terminal domain-containing protein [Deltaproteobacteria bacterium]